MLRAYLREASIAPLPIRRLAAAHPETVDAVFRKLLRKPGFTWCEHGEELLRRRKPWYPHRNPGPAFPWSANASASSPPAPGGRSSP
ncbi:hypothetical protein GCM10010441_55290 [Kitasatospora paracochleata]